MQLRTFQRPHSQTLLVKHWSPRVDSRQQISFQHKEPWLNPSPNPNPNPPPSQNNNRTPSPPPFFSPSSPFLPPFLATSPFSPFVSPPKESKSITIVTLQDSKLHHQELQELPLRNLESHRISLECPEFPQFYWISILEALLLAGILLEFSLDST